MVVEAEVSKRGIALRRLATELPREIALNTQSASDLGLSNSTSLSNTPRLFQTH